MMQVVLAVIIGLSGLLVVFGLVSEWPTYTIPTTAYSDTTHQGVELSQSPTVSALPHRLVVVGDIMLARDVDRRSRVANDPQHPFARISFSNLPAYVLGNFEATMPSLYRETPPMTFTFAVPSSSAPALTQAGFTHLSLANNHSLDYGAVGYQETVSALTQAGLSVAGHSHSLGSTSIMYLGMASGTVAVINISTVGSAPSSTLLQSLMEEAVRTSDWQLVYVHWGVEYELTHHVSQARLSEQLISLGADTIVGHHPHVVQDITYIAGVPVLYSLGNFVFDQYFSSDVQEGLVVVFDFTTESIRLYPVTSKDARVQPRYMTPTETHDFLARLARRSDPALYSQIENGVLPLRGMVASSTKAVMIES